MSASGVEPSAPTAAPSAILPPRLEGISYQWYVPVTYPTLTGKQTGALTWVLPVVDPYTGPMAPLVKFLWRFDGPRSWVDQVISGGCCLEVRVNDVPITSKAMHVSWAGEGLIRTALAFYPFTTSFAQPRRVQFSLTHLGQKFESQYITVWKGEVHSYFTRFLYPMFQHDRCTTCHSLGDAESLLNQHKADDIRFGVSEPLFLPGVAPKVCQNCLVDDWRTPHASLGIDWRGKSAAQICAIVNQRLPTKEAKTHHFHADPRIEWAASSGWILGREKPVVPRAIFRASSRSLTAGSNEGHRVRRNRDSARLGRRPARFATASCMRWLGLTRADTNAGDAAEDAGRRESRWIRFDAKIDGVREAAEEQAP